MKLPLPLHFPGSLTSNGIFRFASLSLYGMLFLYAAFADKHQSPYPAVIALGLVAVALLRFQLRGLFRRSALLLAELAAAMLAISALAPHAPFGATTLPWLIGLAGLFPLVLETSLAILAIAALAVSGLALSVAAGTPPYAYLPPLFAILFAGLCTMLLSQALQRQLSLLPRLPRDDTEQLDAHLPQMVRNHAHMNAALRRALQRNELSVVYQPKVSMIDGSLKGFESLLRWSSARYGEIPPVAFIPVAERSGLVIPIGLWVMEQACKQFGHWLTQYPETRQLTMSINVSMRQLLHSSFTEEVAAILQRTGVPPQLIELELTESSAMTHPAQTIENLMRLKHLGVRLALDDFGTGYSSLAHLRKLPLDVLKIDKAFVQGLDKNSSDIEIVRTILALAQTLKFETVAEGVETREDMAQLKKMGCHIAQGFAFSQAVDAKTAEEMLRSPRCFAVA